MGNTIMIGYWSIVTGLVSDEITNIDKENNLVNIITNVVLPGEWGLLCDRIDPSVTQYSWNEIHERQE